MRGKVGMEKMKGWSVRAFYEFGLEINTLGQLLYVINIFNERDT